MRFLTFIYFYFFISIILTDGYNDDDDDDDVYEGKTDYDANWEIIPDADQEDKRSPNAETGLSSNGSEDDEPCILANIIHSIWSHLTGLADQIERLEKHIDWDEANDTMSVQLNSTDDYPDSKTNKELDITEMKQADKYNNKPQCSNASKETPTGVAYGPSQGSCNGNTCSKAMVIQNGELKVNGTTVKQLANRMEIEKLNKWEEQIKNCKKILEKDPNATLEDISRMHRRKVKEIAVPMRRQRFFRRSNGFRFPQNIRKKRSLDEQKMITQKERSRRKPHKVYRKVRNVQSPGCRLPKPLRPEKIHNYIF